MLGSAMSDSRDCPAPLLSDSRIPPGMLSAPQIRFCVEYHGIIEGFEEDCLHTCTYHMRIGGPVLYWHEGKRVAFTLAKETSLNANKYDSFELLPNSVAFVTTIERFKLRSDIIARFNLKSKHIHQGLLLGTGPIVDPEFTGNLLIPIHNFSSQPLTFAYGEKLISVEFTKTLNPSERLILKDTSYTEYKPNKSRKFEVEDYIVDRLQKKRIESSVASALHSQNVVIEKAETKLRQISVAGFAALILGVIGALGLVYGCWDVISGARDVNKETREMLENTSQMARIEALERQLDIAQTQLNATLQMLGQVNVFLDGEGVCKGAKGDEDRDLR